MIPKTLVQHNVRSAAGVEVVDNPVDGPGIGVTGVDRDRRGAPGPVDAARAPHRSSTGYRQVFPRSVWIRGRSGRGDRGGPSELTARSIDETRTSPRLTGEGGTSKGAEGTADAGAR
jgi:hypothetical protein